MHSYWEKFHPMPYGGIKRKVFVSYSHLDDSIVEGFVNSWAYRENVFIPKVVGVRDTDNFINSDDTEYVMSKIRDNYVGDSSVTIVLIGACTHSRRYVDWEIKASLRQAADGLPNGLLAILLSGLNAAVLPERLRANWNAQDRSCYARYRPVPSTAEQLAGWIEDAYQARTTRAQWIDNPREMMRHNRVCEVHGVTH